MVTIEIAHFIIDASDLQRGKCMDFLIIRHKLQEAILEYL